MRGASPIRSYPSFIPPGSMFRPLATGGEPRVRFTFDGEPHEAPRGVSVAAALLTIAASTRTTPVSGSPRGPYCMMGVCFDCLVRIDGEPNRQACMVTLREGMRIETQDGVRELAGAAPE